MSRKRENIRAALVAEGAPIDEINAVLAELDDERPSVERRAAAAGVPAIYRSVDWASVEKEEANDEAVFAGRRWASGTAPTNGLYLWGRDYGVGKTYIAAAIVNEILANGRRPVRWLDCSRLLTDLNLPFGNPVYAKAAAKLAKPTPRELIVLDDIDKLPATDRNIQPVFALVNDCVGEETALIITANRDLDSLARDFGARFGGALASRLVGHCLDVEVAGRDRRLEP
jgi:DNA replication protein DnaC